MGYWIFVALVLLGIVLAVVVPRHRLKRALERPFPEEWAAILEQKIGIYNSPPLKSCALRK